MSKRTKRTIGRQSAHTGTFEVIHHIEQHPVLRLLGGIARLRAELTTFAVLMTGWYLIDRYFAAGLGAWLILGSLFLAAMLWPRSRRFVTRRVWCVLTRHGIRRCLVERRVMTYEGRLPRLLWSRPTPVGEQVWLWMRPGLAGCHLERITDELASACWAREARVHINPKRTVLVRVEIVRHDPLHAAIGIGSDLVAGLHHERSADVIPLPDRDTVTPRTSDTGIGGDTASPTPSKSTTAPRQRSTTRTRARTTDTAQPAEPEVTGRSGEDVTDYV